MREDIQKAHEKYVISNFFSKALMSLSKKNYEDAESLLNENETVLFVNTANLKVSYVGINKIEKFSGTIFLTDKRIVFKHQSINNFASEIMPLNEVISVHCTADSFNNCYMEAHSSTKIYFFNVAVKRDMLKQLHEEFETAVNNYKSQQAVLNSTSQSNVAPQPDIADQIEKLAQLRDKGIITEEEFQAKKTDLLSRM